MAGLPGPQGMPVVPSCNWPETAAVPTISPCRSPASAETNPSPKPSRIKHINSAGPLVKVEATAEWGAPVYVEMPRERFQSLQLTKKERSVHHSQGWQGVSNL